MRRPWSIANSLICVLVVIAVIEGVSYVFPSNIAQRHAINHVGDCVALLLSLSFILFSAKQIVRREDRIGWLAIGASILLVGIGKTIWMFDIMVIQRANPFPSWPDIAYLLAYLPLWFGLTQFVRLPFHKKRGELLAVELLIAIFACGAFFMLAVLLMHLQPCGHHGFIGNLLLAIYPIFDCATLAWVVSRLLFDPVRDLRASRVLLSFGLFFLVLGDSCFSYVEYTHSVVGGWVGAFWPIAAILLGMGALAQANIALTEHDALGGFHTHPIFRRQSLILYGVVVAICIALLVVFLGGTYHLRTEHRVLLLGTILVFFLVMFRQWWILEENRRLYRHLHSAFEEMAELAKTDPITRLPNYRQLMERLEEEISRSTRYGAPMAIIFADLDFFKRINDTYGHQVGDIVLLRVADALREQMRVTDVLARYGGEEFVALLPQTTLEQAIALAERLRVSIDNISIPMGKSGHITLTISIGVSAFPIPSPTLQALLNDADSAMYRAKQSGRNRVRHFQHAVPLSLPAGSEQDES